MEQDKSRRGEGCPSQPAPMNQGDLEKLALAEEVGRANMAARAANADLVHREAYHLLLLVLAGGGGALSVAAASGGSEVRFAALVVSLYLFGVATWIAMRCLIFGSFPASFNEPRNLFENDLSAEQVRLHELSNLQARIDQALDFIRVRARAHNVAVIATCATPLVGAVAFMLAWVYR